MGVTIDGVDLYCMLSSFFPFLIDRIVISTYATQSIFFIGDKPAIYWSCTTDNLLGTEVDWLHNDTLLSTAKLPSVSQYYWEELNDVNQTGVYTCQVSSNGQVCGMKSVSIYVIGKSK